MSDIYRRIPQPASAPARASAGQSAWWSAHPPITGTDLASWLPEIVAATVIVLLFLPLGGLGSMGWPLAVALSPFRVFFLGTLFTGAVLWRRQPGIALGLAWLLGILCLMAGLGSPLIVLFVFGLIAFGCARYGSVPVLWASGISIGASVFFAFFGAIWVLRRGGSGWAGSFSDLGYPMTPRYLFPLSSVIPLAIAAGLWLLLLGMPWLAGFALRSQQGRRSAQYATAAYQQAHAESLYREAEAKEVAELKESQARLARDVHDVVGHSLAVILAQAESAQYLPKRDLAGRDQVLANIATSARQSLQDVREVLGRTQDGERVSTQATSISLDRLIEGVRSAGNDVRSTVEGQPQPLPPDLESVAYRVLQEMLTNALKHGTRGGPVWVEQHWEGDLRLEVRNVIAEGADGTAAPTQVEETAPIQAVGDDDPGLGLAGMRSRLEAVGGRLDVRRRQEPGVGTTYTATAWMPLRAGG